MRHAVAALLGVVLLWAAPAAARQDLSTRLRRVDPDGLIALQLTAARAYAEAGLTDDAVAAYETALLTILQFRGQGHIDLAQPMTEVARLASAHAVQIAWLRGAEDIRRRAGDSRVAALARP